MIISDVEAGTECDDNSDCEPEEHCLVFTPVCECYCDVGSCWVTDYVPSLEEECDECEGFLTGCGDRVCVHGHGTHTVVDTGSGVAETQLDHYTGVSACNVCTPPGNDIMTIKLF